MWKVIGKVLYSVVVVAFVGSFCLTLLSQAEVAPRVFYGSKEFETVDDALAFQREVVTYTTGVGGQVVKCDIKVQSPPIVTYKLVAPAQETHIFGDKPIQFNYGDPSNPSSINMMYFGAVGMFCLAVIFIWACWMGVRFG